MRASSRRAIAASRLRLRELVWAHNGKAPFGSPSVSARAFASSAFGTLVPASSWEKYPAEEAGNSTARASSRIVNPPATRRSRRYPPIELPVGVAGRPGLFSPPDSTMGRTLARPEKLFLTKENNLRDLAFTRHRRATPLRVAAVLLYPQPETTNR